MPISEKARGRPKLLSEDQVRSIKVSVAVNKREMQMLKSIAHRRGLTYVEAVRKLIEEEGERGHYDLSEPEHIRRKSRRANYKKTRTNQ